MGKEIFIKKYALNDFFTSIFSMFKYVWKDTLILSLIFFIPASIVFYFGYTKFMYMLVDFMKNISNLGNINNSEIFLQYFPDLILSYALLFGSSMIYGLARMFVHSFVSLKAYKKANNQEIYFNENFIVTLTKKFPKLFFQSVLVGFIFTGVIIVLYIIILVPIVIISIANILALTVILVLLEIILVIGFIAFIVWFSIKFTFCQYPIICDDSKIFDGIKKSFYLVKNNFWRVLGLTLLIGIILFFAIRMITGPITSIGSMQSYKDNINYFNEMMNGSYSVDTIIKLLQILLNEGPVMSITMIISGVAESLIMPVFLCLFYIDLKVRKNELVEPASTTDITNG